MRQAPIYEANTLASGEHSRRVAETLRRHPTMSVKEGWSDRLTQGRGQAVEPPMQRQECGKAIAIRTAP